MHIISNTYTYIQPIEDRYLKFDNELCNFEYSMWIIEYMRRSISSKENMLHDETDVYSKEYSSF